MSLPLATLPAILLPKLSRRITGLMQIDGRFEYSFLKLKIYNIHQTDTNWDEHDV